MKLSTVLSGAVVVTLASAAIALQSPQVQSPLVGKAAPQFSAGATDGKTYSLTSVEKKAPMVLAFWKNPCPHNGRASALVNSIVEAYKGKVNFVGVVNASIDVATGFQKQFNSEYPFLADPDKKIIGDFQQRRSIVFVVIGKDKTVESFIGGYSQESMTQLNSAMAKAAGASEATLDFSDAPTRTTYG